MANKALFQTLAGKMLPHTNGVNQAGAKAYHLSNEHQLAQLVVTGSLNKTFYADAQEQLDGVIDLCQNIDGEFIAKLAVYARQDAYMKDMPALLLAILSVKSPEWFELVFDRVIDNGKMLRNFVQIMRSGAVGRKSLGSLPKRMVLAWLDARSDDQLFKDSVGQSPSLLDIVKMVHPKPKTASREALYGYLAGRDVDRSALPDLVVNYEVFKKSQKGHLPKVPFQMLTSLPLTERHWASIARNAAWQMTRMNLNTFARHGVFADKKLVRDIADRLGNPELVKNARVFPYQLLVAYLQADTSVPNIIREALQDAMEIAIDNVPSFAGKVYVFPDVSGSMGCPVTGYRQGSSSAVRCIDVAALMSAAVLRKNRDATVIPFEHQVVDVRLNPRDSVMSNAKILSSAWGGGTNCSAPLAALNHEKAQGDLIIYVSDNESWIDQSRGRHTGLMQQWDTFKRRNPRARMVCIDIQPNTHTQAMDRDDILNIGGFSDRVFDVIARFASGKMEAGHWQGVIDRVKLQ